MTSDTFDNENQSIELLDQIGRRRLFIKGGMSSKTREEYVRDQSLSDNELVGYSSEEIEQ